jgi:hypothetical protein
MASVEKIPLTENLLICAGNIGCSTQNVAQPIGILMTYAALVQAAAESHCFCWAIIVPRCRYHQHSFSRALSVALVRYKLTIALNARSSRAIRQHEGGKKPAASGEKSYVESGLQSVQ